MTDEYVAVLEKPCTHYNIAVQMAFAWEEDIKAKGYRFIRQRGDTRYYENDNGQRLEIRIRKRKGKP